jgi:NTP pyrophosphatase (non-canonical NTP hydrolase)
METPFQIGANVYWNGLGISDLVRAVKHDSELEEAHRGYEWARNKGKVEVTQLNEENNEVLDILQEECAEVVQAVSKIRRFGIDNAKPGTSYTNREHLEEEIGDLLAMIDILQINNIVSWGNLHKAKRAKIEKLKNWSNIPNLENI